MELPPWLILLLLCGLFAAVIARSKNTPVGQAFLVGTVLGPIGIIIVACAKRGLPQAPAGMRAVKCPRCNTVQNVAQGVPQFECWQCTGSYPL